jgi:hypothetical protein
VCKSDCSVIFAFLCPSNYNIPARTKCRNNAISISRKIRLLDPHYSLDLLRLEPKEAAQQQQLVRIKFTFWLLQYALIEAPVREEHMWADSFCSLKIPVPRLPISIP